MVVEEPVEEKEEDDPEEPVEKPKRRRPETQPNLSIPDPDDEDESLDMLPPPHASVWLELNSRNNLLQVLRVLQTITVGTCRFFLKKSDEFTGLSVQTMGITDQAGIIIQLKGDVFMKPGAPKHIWDFRVLVNQLTKKIQSVKQDARLQIYVDENEENLCILPHSSVDQSHLKTLKMVGPDPKECDGLFGFESSDYKLTVEMETVELRTLLNTERASQPKKGEMRVRIFNHKKQPKSWLCLHSNDDAGSSHVSYCSHTKTTPGFLKIFHTKEVRMQDQVQNVPITDVIRVFDDVFSLDLWQETVKVMQGAGVFTLRFSQDKPLVLTFAEIVFFLAPQVPDDRAAEFGYPCPALHFLGETQEHQKLARK